MPVLKDHYHTLQIPVTASTEEIKKAYRRLALIFHPDKHPDKLHAVEKFREISEAYQVLKDRKKRFSYNQERYALYPFKKQIPLAETVEDILQIIANLKKKISLQDPFRMDFDLVYYEINEILSALNILLLHSNTDTESYQNFINQILSCCCLLPYVHKKNISDKLKSMQQKNTLASIQIDQFLHDANQEYFWNKYKIAFALIIAIIICLCIYFVSIK